MRSNRKPATLVACLLLSSLIVVQGSDHRTSLTQVRTLSLPASDVLDQHCQPLIAASGKVGFVASVTGGSLISFSLASGKVLSSFAVGQNVGSISMIETANRRFIAVPAANDPQSGSPATVTVIDATNAKRLDLKSLLVLPRDAQITSSTGAVLTGDGRFCLIASSFDVPTLYSFDVETGQLASHLALIGRPSEIALHDGDGGGGRRLLAVASADKNTLLVIKIDEQGGLSSGANFNPSVARFDEANNPAFSFDGRTVYIAGSAGDRLFAIDSESGIIIDSIAVASPERVTVSESADGIERIGVTRVRRTPTGKAGGVTVIANQAGRLTVRSEFTPPEGVDFSSANNVAFTGDGSVAFVGSASGMLFAFDTDSGELESYQKIGGELRRVALNEKGHSVAVVRSASTGDEVVIVSFDATASDENDPSAPAIDSLSPDTVEQGRLKNLKLVVIGQNFTEGSSLVVNGVEVGADLVKKGRALETRLPKSLFDQVQQISIQVRAANGSLSQPKALNVIRPGAPVIDKISPTEVPGPSGPFTLRVKGSNFRVSSAIVVAGVTLNTQEINPQTLQAVVPAGIADVVAKDPVKVQVKDLAVSDLVSAGDKDLLIYGPRVRDLRTSVGSVIAGATRFTLKIFGDNFRDGAQVAINGTDLSTQRIVYVTRKSIKVIVGDQLFQDAGTLRIVVRNSGGGESDPMDLDVHAPEIASFGQSNLQAGVPDVRVDIFGQNFLRHPRVYVKSTGKAIEVPRVQIRFRDSTHIIVTLAGDSNDLIAKPDTLQFEVVNRNGGDGVPSRDQALDVVGPNISDAVIASIKNDNAHVRITISGQNFRRGATIEFVKDGATVLQQTPVKLRDNLAKVIVKTKRIDALGTFQVRVVNPGSAAPVPSNPFQPTQSANANNNDD